MEKSKFTCSPFVFYAIVLTAVIVVMTYLALTINTFRAFGSYQRFLEEMSTAQNSPASPDTNQIASAIRYDRNHPEYYSTLAKYLHQSGRYDEAEKWLHKAILHDPSNAGYYYEMGRLSLSRGECAAPSLPQAEERWVGEHDCPTVRFFLTALQYASKDTFLRKQIGLWYYRYDREAGGELIRKMIVEDANESIQNPGISRELAKLLYDVQMDYESDLELKRLSQSENDRCKSDFSSGETSAVEVGEFGHDDGSAEWKVRVTSEAERIKKIFCLPENLHEYRSATVKILMNRAAHGGFEVKISVNEHQLPFFRQEISFVPEWHEIPFEISLLHGYTQIAVYVRVQASTHGDYLEIWGDQDSPNRQSTFNFQQTGDLSSDKRKQTGEYMIRLVLRK